MLWLRFLGFGDYIFELRVKLWVPDSTVPGFWPILRPFANTPSSTDRKCVSLFTQWRRQDHQVAKLYKIEALPAVPKQRICGKCILESLLSVFTLISERWLLSLDSCFIKVMHAGYALMNGETGKRRNFQRIFCFRTQDYTQRCSTVWCVFVFVFFKFEVKLL